MGCLMCLDGELCQFFGGALTEDYSGREEVDGAKE